MTLTKKQLNFICSSLSMAQMDLASAIGYKMNLKLDLSVKTLAALNLLCRVSIGSEVPDLLALCESTISDTEAADLSGLSRRSIQFWAETEGIEAAGRWPYFFIWKHDLPKLLAGDDISKILAKCPVWLWRKDKGLPIYKASVMLGVGTTTIEQFEAGVDFPTGRRLKRVKEVLGDGYGDYGKWWKELKKYMLKK